MCTAATPDTDTAPRADEPRGPPSAASGSESTQPAMTADLSRKRGAKVKTYARTIALTITAGMTTTLRELATQGALNLGAGAACPSIQANLGM